MEAESETRKKKKKMRERSDVWTPVILLFMRISNTFVDVDQHSRA
jgi:hypothetical protein